MNTFIHHANLILGDPCITFVEQCPTCYAIEFEDFERECDMLLVEHTLRDVCEFHGGDLQKGGISVLPSLIKIIANSKNLFGNKNEVL